MNYLWTVYDSDYHDYIMYIKTMKNFNSIFT